MIFTLHNLIDPESIQSTAIMTGRQLAPRKTIELITNLISFTLFGLNPDLDCKCCEREERVI